LKRKPGSLLTVLYGHGGYVKAGAQITIKYNAGLRWGELC
jgi:hypothetical protein